MAPPTVFEQYPVAQWQADGFQRLAFPVIDVDEGGGNRLVERERPYREGAKLDDTGSRATRWTLEAIFENSIEEEGIAAVNGDTVLYPDVLNLMVESFGIHATGDLSVPTRGWVRARLETYSRKENPGEQDTGRLTMTFVEDNEDAVDARAFAAPTVSANARRLSEVTSFSEQSDGIWGDDSVTLQEFSADLESWATAPGEVSRDVDQKAGSTIGSANRVIRAFSDPNTEGRDTLRNPESSQTARKLETTKELAGRSRAESRRGRPQKITVVFEEAQSIATIAALLGQSHDDLLAINPQLPNPLYIPPGTLVWILV